MSVGTEMPALSELHARSYLLQPPVVAARRVADDWQHDDEIRQVYDLMPDAVLLLNGRGRIAACNATALSLFGYDEDELVGREIGLLWRATPDARQYGRWAGRGAARSGIALPRKGASFPAALTLLTHERAATPWPVAIIEDLRSSRDQIEQLREMQSELARLARLNELGEMASTLTHELAQPLATIANYAQGCIRMAETNGPAAGDPIRDALEEIAGHALWAGEIIQHMRTFISRGGGEKKAESVHGLIVSAMKLALTGSRSSGLRTERQLRAGDDVVVANRVQLEQVLTNLVRNAIEAMDGLPDPSLVIRTRNQDDALIVEVSDNGCGIAAEMKAALFRPFVSSKPRGLGIGLAMSKRIIEAHGGHIGAHSEPQGGTTFTFTLPLMRARHHDE